MARRITLRFNAGADRFQIWIFAEDLSRSPEQGRLSGTLPMEQADAVIDRLAITAVRAKAMRRMLRFTQDLLAKHFLVEQATIEID